MFRGIFLQHIYCIIEEHFFPSARILFSATSLSSVLCSDKCIRFPHMAQSNDFIFWYLLITGQTTVGNQFFSSVVLAHYEGGEDKRHGVLSGGARSQRLTNLTCTKRCLFSVSLLRASPPGSFSSVLVF